MSAPASKPEGAAGQRPHFAVFVGTSLDGYIADREGSLDFLKAVEGQGEDYGYADFKSSKDAALLGRTTYETLLAMGPKAWEYSYGGKRVFILTHRPLNQAAPVDAAKEPTESAPAGAGGQGPYGETPISAGTMADLAAQLAHAGASRVYVDGGAVVQELLAEGFVDELIVSIIPTLLGGGTRLFGELPPDGGSGGRKLKFVGSQAWSNTGLVQLRYKFE